MSAPAYLFRVAATYAFPATEDGDLPFAKGAVLCVTETDEDWFTGYVEGDEGIDENTGEYRVGTFPENRTKRIEEDETPGKDEDDEEAGGGGEDDASNAELIGEEQPQSEDEYEEEENNRNGAYAGGAGPPPDYDDDDARVAEEPVAEDDDDDEEDAEEEEDEEPPQVRQQLAEDPRVLQDLLNDAAEGDADDGVLDLSLSAAPKPKQQVSAPPSRTVSQAPSRAPSQAPSRAPSQPSSKPGSAAPTNAPSKPSSPALSQASSSSEQGRGNKDMRKVVPSAAPVVAVVQPAPAPAPAPQSRPKSQSESRPPVAATAAELVNGHHVFSEDDRSTQLHSHTVVDDRTLKTIARLIDARLAAEFGKREDAMKELQSTMGKMRMQMQIQSNTWRQFVSRNGKAGDGSRSPTGGGGGPVSPNPPSDPSGSKKSPRGVGGGGAAALRFESYSFDANLPRVALIPKKNKGELSELDLHRMAQSSAVVRYAEARSAVYEPSNFDPETASSAAPQGSLQLEHAHGFSGRSSKCTNCLTLASGEIVFPSSAAVVIMNPATNSQRFFLEHDDDVTALAVHPNLDIVASGQLARKAFVLVYDVSGNVINFVTELHLGVNTRGVKCLDFSPDGEMLLCVAADPYHTVSIWDWKKGYKLAGCRANNAEVFSMRFNPTENYNLKDVSAPDAEYTLVSVGARHMKFWTLTPDDSIVADSASKDDKEARVLASRLGKWKIESSMASFGGKAKIQDITCVAFIADNEGDVRAGVAPFGRVVTGTDSGSFFVFENSSTPAESSFEADDGVDADGVRAVKKTLSFNPRGIFRACVKEGHNGSVLDIAAAGKSDIIASVGRDNCLKLWRITSGSRSSSADEVVATDDMVAIGSVDVIGSSTQAGVSMNLGTPRTVAWSHDFKHIYVGTTGSSVIAVKVSGVDGTKNGAALKLGEVSVVLRGHASTIRQVVSHPTRNIYATVSDDSRVTLWDRTTKKIFTSIKMPAKVYSAAFSPNGNDISIGLVTGDIYVKTIPGEKGGEWISVIRKRTGNKDKEAEKVSASAARNRAASVEADDGDEEGGKKVKKLEREDIKNSVTKMAYSPDGTVLVAACRDNFLYLFDVAVDYKKRAVMKGHSTFVTHMDFSADSAVLQSNDAAREILYWDVTVGRQLANSFDLRDTAWSTWSCLYGWSVQGIWDQDQGGEQNILSVARSKDGLVVATGDASRTIKLFRYPALKGCANKSYLGHKTPVVSLAFSPDDKKLYSTGGTDCSVFQWSFGGGA